MLSPFQSNPCQHPIVILRDVSPDDLQSLLAFMYNGEVRIEEGRLKNFLRTAEMLQVQGLADGGGGSGQPPGSRGSGVAVASPSEIVRKRTRMEDEESAGGGGGGRVSRIFHSRLAALGNSIKIHIVEISFRKYVYQELSLRLLRLPYCFSPKRERNCGRVCL